MTAELVYDHRVHHLAAYGVDASPVPSEITLLAFDPGGTTGWFQATFNPETGDVDYDSMRYSQMSGRHHGELLNHLKLTLTNWPHLMIVTEDYRPEFARAQNYVALEYIGVMEAFGQNKLVSVERQNRDIKKFWASERLRKLKMWPRAMPHAQDAARHWLEYATKQSRPLEVKIAEAIRD